MINPINISTNPTYYSKMPAKQSQGVNVTTPSFELSDYKTGQAILARNNISFRNLATPIEVTNKYNKKIEGKDHLDLPNIHIYEYPDTNLKLFVNIDNSRDNKLNSTAQYISSIDIDPDFKIEPMKYLIITKILDNKFDSEGYKDSYSNTLMCTKEIKNANDILKISKFNKILTTEAFSLDDLEMAKKYYKTYLSSNEFMTNTKINETLFENKLKTPEDILNEIETMKLDDVRKYYKALLENSKMSVYLTINLKEFKQHEKAIFENINKNIAPKFLREVSSKNNDLVLNNTKFVNIFDKDNNSEIRYFIKNQDPIIPVFISKLYAKYYPDEKKRIDDYINHKIENFKDKNIKDIDLEKLTVKLYEEKIKYLNSYSDKPYFEALTPEEGITALKYEPYTYYEIPVNNLTEINDLWNSLLNKDLSHDISEIKKDFKEYSRIMLTDEVYSLMPKNFLMAMLDKNIFSIYEQIDDINQDKVKNYIKENFVKRNPIIISKTNSKNSEDK